jgi:hypothetical protein
MAITIMAHIGFNEALKTGDKVELETANLVAEHGFSAHKLGGGFGQKIPYSIMPDALGNPQSIKAPDLLIKKFGWPDVGLEVKAKKAYSDTYILDKFRVEQLNNWALATDNPAFFVFKLPPYEELNSENFVCSSIEKLYGNHVLENVGATDRYGKPCPTVQFESSMFLPFTELLSGNVKHQTKISMYIPDNSGELVLI